MTTARPSPLLPSIAIACNRLHSTAIALHHGRWSKVKGQRSFFTRHSSFVIRHFSLVTRHSSLVTKPARRRRAGFTLLELIIVLSILSLVSLLAARSIHSAQDQRRRAAADRQLDAIRAAVWPESDPALRALSTPALPGGFVSDLGRLPRAMPVTNADTHGVAYAPTELFARPADVPAFALVPVTPATVCPDSPDPCDPALDASVAVPAGWRGPYLPAPVASSSAAFSAPLLRDPWGVPVAAFPLDPYGLTNRLSADGSFTDARPFAPVAYVRHLGADLAPENTPFAVSNAFHADAVLDLSPATNATAVLSYDLPEDASAASVVFRLYLPCPDPAAHGHAPHDAPALHILTQTVAATLGEAAVAAFPHVPAGWHPASAAPEGDPALRRTFWTFAR